MHRRRFLRGTALAATLAGCVELRNPAIDENPTPPDDPDYPQDVRERAREVGERARESVVVAEADRPGPAATTGAAWFVEPDSLATTAHGVAGSETVTAWTLDGDSMEASVSGRTEGTDFRGDDVAILGTDREMAPLETGDSGSLEGGQPLVQVGHPYAVGNWIVSLGRFVGSHGRTDRLLSTLPTMQGNSGSPVLTLDGECVAMTTGSVPRDQQLRRVGEAPDPAPPHVHEAYDDATYGFHHAVETVEEYVAEWGKVAPARG